MRCGLRIRKTGGADAVAVIVVVFIKVERIKGRLVQAGGGQALFPGLTAPAPVARCDDGFGIVGPRRRVRC